MKETSPGRIRGVIFDLDGTLVESYSGHIESWIRAVASHGVTATEEDVKPHMGRSSEDIARALLGSRPPEEVLQASQRKDEIFFEIIPQVLTPMEGATEVIQDLKQRGLGVAVASSNPMEVITRSLEAVGLAGLVDSITSQDEVEHGKPAPDLFVKAVSKFGLSGWECMAVGDTRYDIIGAKGAGMVTVAYLGGCQSEDELARSHPDHVIGSLREISAILDAMG